MTKATLAFIDHSFHQKSNATRFLIELLQKYYEVTIYWDKSWIGGPKVDLKDIARSRYNTVIIFQQTHFTGKEIEAISQNNTALIPMFDDSREFPETFWEKFKFIKFINFSRQFHAKLQTIGITSRYFQYFPQPLNQPQPVNNPNELSGFFWQRTGKITWNHIRELIKNAGFKKFHIHEALDPPGNYPFIIPSEEEKQQYDITFSTWNTGREEYLKRLKAATVFFAPRMYEGIGMSILEAMKIGICVVAPDNPTMNEYISHGKTGLLYDPDNPSPLDFSKLEEIRINTLRYIEQGYSEWQKSEKELIHFIKQPLHKPGFTRRMTDKVSRFIQGKLKK